MPQASLLTLGVIGLMTAAVVAAVTIVGMALYWIPNDPVAASLLDQLEQGTLSTFSGAGSERQADGGTPACSPAPSSSTAQVQVSVRPVAPLTAEVTAQVTVGQDSLMDAAPMATADMLEMRCAHTIPEVFLQAVPGKPGLYRGQVRVVMVGTWEFIVRLKSGITGEGSAVMPVTTLAPE